MKKGFTLVELLIVMVVVTILVTVAIPKYKVAMEKGRGLEGLHNAQAISDALNAFYIQDGEYKEERLAAVLAASGVTTGKYFEECTITMWSDYSEVTCKRNNSSYQIVFSNSEGATGGKRCDGEEKYCRALGATLPGNSGELSFPQ